MLVTPGRLDTATTTCSPSMEGGSKGEISERVPGVSLAWENVNYVVETKINSPR